VNRADPNPVEKALEDVRRAEYTQFELVSGRVYNQVFPHQMLKHFEDLSG